VPEGNRIGLVLCHGRDGPEELNLACALGAFTHEARKRKVRIPRAARPWRIRIHGRARRFHRHASKVARGVRNDEKVRRFDCDVT
jgi:hypothetical protein